MKRITIGLDIAKSVFPVHGEGSSGKIVVQKRLRRSQVLAFFAGLGPALIGLEACGSAHYWGRELRALGHDVRLIPAADVKPFVRRNKPAQQERRARCGSDVHGGRPSGHAVCGDQERRKPSLARARAVARLTPRGASSGLKRRQGGISRQGDIRLRKLLALGARTIIRSARSRAARATEWQRGILARRPVTVAVA